MKRFPVTLTLLLGSIIIMLAGLAIFLTNLEKDRKLSREISRLTAENLRLRQLNLANAAKFKITDTTLQIPVTALKVVQERAAIQLENDRRLQELEKISLFYTNRNQIGVAMMTCSVLFLVGFNVFQIRKRYALKRKEARDQQTMFLLRETIRQKTQIEEALLREKERLQFVLEGTNAATWEWNIQTGQMHYNETWAKIIGYTLEEIQPIDENTLSRFAHPEDLEATNEKVKACLRDQTLFYEGTYRMRHKEGYWVWILDRGKVVKSTEDGKPMLMFGTHVDISPLKETNEELTRFASLASHEMREPLRMVSSFMRLLEKNYSTVLDKKAHQYIHYALDGADRMTALIKELLSFANAGAQTGNREWINCNQLLNQIKENLQTQLDEHQAEMNIEEMPSVQARKTPLKLVFQNLIGNALKYQEPGNQPVITISGKDIQTHWEFSVKDNGIGIAPEQAHSAFDLFKRLKTKNEYAGSGMGLATCKRIIEQHGGKIWIESNGNKGTILTFTIRKTA